MYLEDVRKAFCGVQRLGQRMALYNAGLIVALPRTGMCRYLVLQSWFCTSVRETCHACWGVWRMSCNFGFMLQCW